MTVNGLAARSTAREMDRQRRQVAAWRILTRVTVYAVAAGAALVCAAPFLWGLAGALRHDGAPVRSLLRSGFPALVANTLIVGGLVVVVTLALALPAAYALARLKRSWGTRAGVAILLVQLVPPSLLFLSLSRTVATLGVADSLWSLVLVYPTVTVPVSIWLLIGFFRAVPPDLEEQAMVDGQSRLGAFLRVVTPLVMPGIAAVVVLTFTLTAGEFTYALTFVWSGARMPVSTGLPARLGNAGPALWRSVQAGTVLMAIPLGTACSFFLDRFLAGLSGNVGDEAYGAGHGDMG
jgi:multiple sugar transport system permease protein